MIFSHGYGFNETIIDFRQLAKRGVATYAFDFGGGAFDSRSDGSSRHMSVMTEAKELDAVLKQLRHHPLVDDQRILLCGHSQGGYVSTVTGITDQELVCGLVLLSPAFVISTDAKKYFASSRQPKYFPYFNMVVSRQYYSDLKDYDPYAEMKKFKKPVMIVHGDVDSLVPLSYSRRAKDSFPNARLFVAHGAGHMLNGYQTEIINRIVQMMHF